MPISSCVCVCVLFTESNHTLKQTTAFGARIKCVFFFRSEKSNAPFQSQPIGWRNDSRVEISTILLDSEFNFGTIVSRISYGFHYHLFCCFFCRNIESLTHWFLEIVDVKREKKINLRLKKSISCVDKGKEKIIELAKWYQLRISFCWCSCYFFIFLDKHENLNHLFDSWFIRSFCFSLLQTQFQWQFVDIKLIKISNCQFVVKITWNQ